MFVTVELLYGTQGRKEKEKRMIESLILKYITSVYNNTY
jgi:hypothetical protein